MSNIWQGSGVWQGWKLTTDHPSSSYGQPVLVNPEGIAFGPGDIVVHSEILTVSEAANLYQMDVSTLRKACITGRLPARKSGATWLVFKDALKKEYGEPK